MMKQSGKQTFRILFIDLEISKVQRRGLKVNDFLHPK